METRHPPLVLILDIAAGAVPDDDDRDVVGLARDDPISHVVLARQTAVGAVADERAVDVDRVHALGARYLHHDLGALPPRGTANVRR